MIKNKLLITIIFKIYKKNKQTLLKFHQILVKDEETRIYVHYVC